MQRQRRSLRLWKSEGRRKETTLQRRLIFFFVSLAAFLIFAFALLMVQFGFNRREETALRTFFDSELNHIAGAVYDDFGLISVDGVQLAERLSAACDEFFAAQNMEASALADRPELIEPLLAAMNSRSCGGMFLMLDATARPQAENAADSRAGIFLKKDQPAATGAVGGKSDCLRGRRRSPGTAAWSCRSSGAWNLISGIIPFSSM